MTGPIVGAANVHLAGPAGDWSPVGFSTGPFMLSGDHNEDMTSVKPLKSTHDYPAVMDFNVSDLDHNAIRLMFGERVGMAASRPSTSVLIETIDWVPARPELPVRLPGWRGWWEHLTGGYKHRLNLWAIKKAAWVAAGRPDRPAATRRQWFPDAHVHIGTPVPADDGSLVVDCTITPNPGNGPNDARWYR